LKKIHWNFIGFGFFALNIYLLSQQYGPFPGWPLLWGGISIYFGGGEVYPVHLQVIWPTIACVSLGSFCLAKASMTEE
jgi:hypothetical protein